VPDLPVDDSLAAPFTRLTLDRVRQVASHDFGIDVIDLHRLDTERDDTFVLDDAMGQRVLLKVAHPTDSFDMIDLSVQAMTHVAARDQSLPIPAVIGSTRGELLTTVAGMDDEPRYARALTWLPGRVPTLDVLTARQAARRGSLLGRLNVALSDFEHQGSRRYIAWDLQQVGTLRPFLEHVADARTRELVAAQLDTFDGQTGPKMRSLRQQVIHNDLNSDNVLVANDDTDLVTGILDFGDVVFSATVADVGLAMSYVIDVGRPERDAWLNPYALANAFHAHQPLTDQEWELLPALVRARLSQRLLLGSWLSATNPDNAEYTSRTLESATIALALIHDRDPHEGLRDG